MFGVLFGVLFQVQINIKVNIYIRNTQQHMFGVHFGVLCQERININVKGFCSNVQAFATPITHLSNCESTNQKHKAIFVCLFLFSVLIQEKEKKYRFHTPESYHAK